MGLSLSGGLDARTLLGVLPAGANLKTVSLGIEGSLDHKSAWELSKKFFDGTVANSEINLTARKLEGNNMELRFNAVRGLYYKVLSSTDVAGPYENGGAAGQVAWEASIATTNPIGSAPKFFRVSGSLTP